MPKIPSLLFVTRKELLSLISISIFWVCLIGFFYILFTLFLFNYRLVAATISHSFPIQNKMSVLFSLVGGLFTAFSPLDSMLLIITALLVGINILLIFKTISVLEHTGKLKFSVGGATIIGLISTGCSPCGFSVLSLMGLGASLSFLPFHGLELHILSLGLLLFSAFYMLTKLRDSKYCER